MRIELPEILSAPSIPNHLDENVKWLSGEGAGSWFLIESVDEIYEVSRYSPAGELECTSSYSSLESINLTDEYSITYPSHCAVITVVQNDKLISLKAILTGIE